MQVSGEKMFRKASEETEWSCKGWQGVMSDEISSPEAGTFAFSYSRLSFSNGKMAALTEVEYVHVYISFCNDSCLPVNLDASAPIRRGGAAIICNIRRRF
jgi:hypothetical protein